LTRNDVETRVAHGPAAVRENMIEWYVFLFLGAFARRPSFAVAVARAVGCVGTAS